MVAVTLGLLAWLAWLGLRPWFTNNFLLRLLFLLFIREPPCETDRPIQAVEKLLDTAIEMDTGRYGSMSCVVIMYTVRLAVRLEGYLQFVCDHADWLNQDDDAAAKVDEEANNNNGAGGSGGDDEIDDDDAMAIRVSRSNSLALATKAAKRKRQRRKRTTGNGAQSFTRGLELGVDVNEAALARLRKARAQLRDKVAEQAVPMLERWLRLALRDEAMEAACTIFAHLAYRYKNRRPEDLDAQAVSTLQVSQIFLNIHHHFHIDATSGAEDAAFDSPAPAAAAAAAGGSSSAHQVPWLDTGLGIPETEVFDLFQRFRHHSLHWLSEHPRQCNEIMENIVKTVTLMGRDRHQQAASQAMQQLSLAAAAIKSPGHGGGDGRRTTVVDGLGGVDGNRRGTRKGTAVVTGALGARAWSSLSAHGCFGRFVPDTENEQEMGHEHLGNHNSGGGKGGVSGLEEHSRAVSTLRPGENFEAWLRRVTTGGVGTEINVQLGEFTMKKHRMTQLRADVRRTAEFRAVFEDAGSLPPHVRVQCAEVKHTTQRAWWRLVGRRHDVQWWLPDVGRSASLPVPRHPQGNLPYQTVGGELKVAGTMPDKVRESASP